MMTINKTLRIAKNLVLSATIVLTLVQCSEEEIMAPPDVVEDASTEVASESADVASISVAGLYTEITGDVDCSTCTYVVGTGETAVDGKALAISPGSIICLKKAWKYSSIDFVNMEGTEQQPIVIGYCAE